MKSLNIGQMANLQVEHSDTLSINQNRMSWDEAYLKIRELSIRKSLIIKDMTEDKFKGNEVVIYRGGRVIFKPLFVKLPEEVKKKVVEITSQITKLYVSLRESNLGVNIK